MEENPSAAIFNVPLAFHVLTTLTAYLDPVLLITVMLESQRHLSLEVVEALVVLQEAMAFPQTLHGASLASNP